EYSHRACDGHSTAAAFLRRIISARLVNRHGLAAKRLYLSKGLSNMSERNFSRRRRGGMRFRPSGGLGHAQRPDREATQARAEAGGGPSVRDRGYDHRHTTEIDRAGNVAAGLPPDGCAA